MNLWRISSFADLSGRGGLLAEGRWHRRGVPIVYCSDHPSTALLEILVHVDLEDIPANFQLLTIHCPDTLSVTTVEADDERLSDPAETRKMGTEWLAAGETCLLKVPSIILPEAANVLINPRHADAESIVIEKSVRRRFDERFFR